jgi:hypothetical protein
MANYILRHVNDDLWKRFKARAESDGHALKWVLLELVAYYATNGLPRKRG